MSDESISPAADPRVALLVEDFAVLCADDQEQVLELVDQLRGRSALDEFPNDVPFMDFDL